MDLVVLYFFHEVFKIQNSFTDSRNSLTCYGKAGGADDHEKEVACDIKNERELSVVLIDKQKKKKKRKVANKTLPGKKRNKVLKPKAKLLKS